MKTTFQLKKTYQELPPNLRRFLIRGAILFIAWELLYTLLLKPVGVPDKQLTDFVIFWTDKVLHLFYTDVRLDGATIVINGSSAVTIRDACNGLEMEVLYIGFLLCLPTTRKRFWGYALIGLVIINILNIGRCVALAYMFYKNIPIADFAHHYIFKLIIFGIIFVMWMMYSKKYTQSDAANTTTAE